MWRNRSHPVLSGVVAVTVILASASASAPASAAVRLAPETVPIQRATPPPATPAPAPTSTAAPTAAPAERVAPPAQPEPAPVESVSIVEPMAFDYDAAVTEGEFLLDNGEPADGAERLADAYVLMPADVRVGEKGRQVVARASAAYQSAGASASRLEAERVLLTAYFADLGEARAAARPTVPDDAVEQQLAARLHEVEQQFAELPAASGEIGRVEASPPVPAPTLRERRVALSLFGLGGAGLLVGGVMVGVGAKAASDAEELRSMTNFEDAGEARRAKTNGVLLATFGALVFSGSVMMVGVGSNRLGELRERNQLSIAPTRRGLALSGRF